MFQYQLKRARKSWRIKFKKRNLWKYLCTAWAVNSLAGGTGRERTQWFRDGVGAVVKCHHQETFGPRKKKLSNYTQANGVKVIIKAPLNFSDPPSRVSSKTPFDMISTCRTHTITHFRMTHTDTENIENKKINPSNYLTYICGFGGEWTLGIFTRARVSWNHGPTGL